VKAGFRVLSLVFRVYGAGCRVPGAGSGAVSASGGRKGVWFYTVSTSTLHRRPWRCKLTQAFPGREFFIDKLLVRVHFIIMMIRWTGLAPREFESPLPGGLASTFLGCSKPMPCTDGIGGWRQGFGVKNLGLGVYGVGFRFWGSGFRV